MWNSFTSRHSRRTHRWELFIPGQPGEDPYDPLWVADQREWSLLYRRGGRGRVQAWNQTPVVNSNSASLCAVWSSANYLCFFSSCLKQDEKTYERKRCKVLWIVGYFYYMYVKMDLSHSLLFFSILNMDKGALVQEWGRGCPRHRLQCVWYGGFFSYLHYTSWQSSCFLFAHTSNNMITVKVFLPLIFSLTRRSSGMDRRGGVLLHSWLTSASGRLCVVLLYLLYPGISQLSLLLLCRLVWLQKGPSLSRDTPHELPVGGPLLPPIRYGPPPQLCGPFDSATSSTLWYDDWMVVMDL